MSIYHRVDTTCQNQKYVLQQQCLFITELIPRVRPKSMYYNNNVYLSQSCNHVSDPKVRITTTMSIYHRVDTTCQTQKYVLQQQCLFITELIPLSDPKVRITTTMSIAHRVDTCQTQKYVLQQQCLSITLLIPRVRHKSTYYNNNVYLYTWLIPRVRHKVHYNTNVYLSQSWYHVSDTKVRITTTMSIYQSWYHVSDTKVRITTTMSIYHRVNTMCQTQKYVLQQLCLFITELIPRVRHKSTHYNNNVYLSQSWYHLSDTKVCITTTMSIYHRVNTTCQTQKYVLQQQCLFITELIPRVRHKSTYYNNNVYLSQSWYHVSDPKTYYNNNVNLPQSWYHVSDTKWRITTTMYLSQSWYHVSDPKVRITTTMSIYHRVNTTCHTQKYVLQQQCLLITELIPRVRPKSTYYNNNVYLSQSWCHVSDPKVRITTTMSIDHRVDTTCQTQKYVLQQQCLFITEL